MATAASISRWSLPVAHEYSLQGGGGNQPLTMNPERRTVIVLDDKGDHELPLGTRCIHVQNRMCGDFYCCIEGKTQVAATGKTLSEAFLNALALAA